MQQEYLSSSDRSSAKYSGILGGMPSEILKSGTVLKYLTETIEVKGVQRLHIIRKIHIPDKNFLTVFHFLNSGKASNLYYLPPFLKCI